MCSLRKRFAGIEIFFGIAQKLLKFFLVQQKVGKFK